MLEETARVFCESIEYLSDSGKDYGFKIISFELAKV